MVAQFVSFLRPDGTVMVRLVRNYETDTTSTGNSDTKVFIKRRGNNAPKRVTVEFMLKSGLCFEGTGTECPVQRIRFQAKRPGKSGCDWRWPGSKGLEKLCHTQEHN